MTKPQFALRLLLAGLCGLASSHLLAQSSQHIVFTGLRSVANQGQFNAVKTDATGNLYLLLDQKDGVRLLKTDPAATTVLAQTQLGAKGDIGLAMALDPTGDIYITGTTTSGSLTATSGAAFPTAADTSTNSFIAKFDPNLNPLFVTYTGSGRTAVSSIAATANAVFITGSTFTTTLPVTPSGVVQTPASGSFQNGFVEKFNATGTTLLYATYLSAFNGDTAPSAIAADTSDNAYITGYTTSTGYPTLNALIPEFPPSSTTSGFLTKLAPAGDSILFSTFIPGTGPSSLAFDPATQNLLLSGTIDLGQFPITNVQTPLVNTNYQTLIRLPLDGGTVLSSTLLAPGTQSSVTQAPSGAAWITGTLTTPLLPLPTLSNIGNAYAVRVTAQNTIDQAVRFGGLPTTNAAFSSAPVNATSITTDTTGQLILAGSVTPTTSSSLLATQTYDLSLTTPTTALPSLLRDTIPAPNTCSGSLCSGSAAFLAKLDPTTSAPTLAISTDDAPNIILRNLGTAPATNLQISTTTHNCGTTLSPGAECTIAAQGPTTLTVQAANSTTQTITIPATTATPNPIAISTRELDFGIQTAITNTPSFLTPRSITVTNLTQQSQTFTSKLDSTPQSAYTISENAALNCPVSSSNTRFISPGATCTIGLLLTPHTDSPISANWLIGTQDILITGYSQSAALTTSTPHIDFGTQYTNGIQLPRFLYLSNNSTAAIPHAVVTLPSTSPFTIEDNCPTTLEPRTVCQIELTYSSPQTSADSTTLTLDQNLTVLVTGKTIPQPGVNGSLTNPNLSVSPATINFPDAVVVAGISASTQNVTISNTGTQPFTLALTLSGDFTDTTNCPSTLPGGVICTVTLTFAPSAPGTRQGLLTVSAGAGTTPTYVTLSGTATSILPSNNGTLDFGSVIVGQPSVQWYKITQPFPTLTAASTSDYTAILVEDLGYGHGQPASSAFTADTTGPCTNCWLGIQFKPSATGPRPATLTLSSGTTGNPYTLSLTGNGLALTGLVLTPATQDFGPAPIHSTTAATLFTLTNLSPSPITLTSITLTGDFALSAAPTGGQACTNSQALAPTTSCFLQVTFVPTATGERIGTITLQTSYGTISSALTGYGSPDPGFSLNPTALVFNNIPDPTATQQTITLTNTSAYNLQVNGFGLDSSHFQINTPALFQCNSVAPGASCTLTVTFQPTNSTVTGNLSLTTTSSFLNTTTTSTIPLIGAYTTEDTGLQIIPDQANYGPTPTSTLGLARQFTINNLTTKSLALDIALPRQFALTSPPCTTLAPGGSCDFTVAFLPLTNGDITGTLFAQATPTDGSATFNGIGYVEGYGTGVSSLAITGGLFPGNLLNFNQVTSGQTSSKTLTLTNPGPTPITVRRITTEWPFLSTTTCGSTLSANQSCTVTINYTPLYQLAAGTASPLPTTDAGTLVIESDAASSPDLIDLSGNAAPVLVSSPANTAPLVSFTTSQGSLTFPATQVGNASASQTVTLTNTGTATIHIVRTQTTPDFTVTSNCAALFPSATCTLTATFTPQSTGVRTGDFTPQSTDTRIGAVEITSDSSTSLEFISLLGTASPANLVFSPTSLDFGSVLVGSTSTLPIQITNVSTTPAIFNSITATGDYAATGTCPTPGNVLAPSATCTIQIAFNPTVPGTRTGTLSLNTSLTSLPLTAALTGIGTQSQLQIAPASLNFGAITVGSEATLTLTLSNTGTAPIHNLVTVISGDYVIAAPCALTALTPGSSCSITVTFIPPAIGPRLGVLAVGSTDQSSPAIVPLTGTGKSGTTTTTGTFTLTVNGGTTSTVTVVSGEPASYNLTLAPQDNFTGPVVLNCTPVTPGQYATCSLLPSSITLNGIPQNAIATINTVTEVSTAANHPSNPATLLCLLPAALLLLCGKRKHRLSITLTIALLSIAIISATGCGSGGRAPTNSTNLRYTPPGTYQYQITANSTSNPNLTQAVTLNLVVTPQ
jgi:trimeric autotransporter adhesin